MKRTIALSFKPSSCLILTILKLCLMWSTFNDPTTPMLASTHCCSSNKRSWHQRSPHSSTETTALSSHLRSYCLQNLLSRVSHTLWNLFLICGILGHTTLNLRL